VHPRQACLGKSSSQLRFEEKSLLEKVIRNRPRLHHFTHFKKKKKKKKKEPIGIASTRFAFSSPTDARLCNVLVLANIESRFRPGKNLSEINRTSILTRARARARDEVNDDLNDNNNKNIALHERHLRLFDRSSCKVKFTSIENSNHSIDSDRNRRLLSYSVRLEFSLLFLGCRSGLRC